MSGWEEKKILFWKQRDKIGRGGGGGEEERESFARVEQKDIKEQRREK